VTDLKAEAALGKNPLATKTALKAAEIDLANQSFGALAHEWHASRLGGRPYVSIMPMEWMELVRGLECEGILDADEQSQSVLQRHIRSRTSDRARGQQSSRRRSQIFVSGKGPELRSRFGW
jgi:hypothetical protein